MEDLMIFPHALFDNSALFPPAIRWPNLLLASLPKSDCELLRPHLRAVELPRGAVLAKAGQNLTHVYFPWSGVISLTVSLSGGKSVAVAMVGNDGVLGASAALGGLESLSDTIVQLPGMALTLEIERLRTAAEKSATVRTTLIRHEQALFAQVQQIAACNTSHTVEARLSRCLLCMRELSDNDTLPITQEYLAEMIGVQRNAVSVVAHALQRAHVIRYSRGLIRIIDVGGLNRTSCRCHLVAKTHRDRLLARELEPEATFL